MRQSPNASEVADQEEELAHQQERRAQISAAIDAHRNKQRQKMHSPDEGGQGTDESISQKYTYAEERGEKDKRAPQKGGRG